MSIHGARRPRWYGRWAKNLAIALAPLCALGALLVVGAATRELVPALIAYAAGAAAGAFVGALLGGVTGAVRLRLQQRRRRRRASGAPAGAATWVLHRPASAPGGRLVHH